MLVDYCLEGQKTTEPVTSINKSFERYFNAGGNSHYSHNIETKNFNFNISESYYKLINKDDLIIVEESLIFKEINTSRIIKENYIETYSLRRISGLVIPLLMLIAAFLSYKFKDKVDILVFVSQVVMFANLIYLVFY